MTTTTRTDNGGQDDPYLIAMQRQAQELIQTGQQLTQTVRASAPQPQTRQQQPRTVQQEPETVVVEPGNGDFAIVLAEPRSRASKVQSYLQRQLAIAACFVLAASLARKLPPIWDHREIGVVVGLLIATLVLHATGAKPDQEAGDRLWAAVEMGERDHFHKHLQILLLHRESRYLLLLESAIGMLLADAFATTFLK